MRDPSLIDADIRQQQAVLLQLLWERLQAYQRTRELDRMQSWVPEDGADYKQPE